MREFKKHRSRRAELLNFGLRLAGATLLLVFTIGMVRAAWDMYGRLATATAGQQDAEARLASLEAQKKAISASVDQLSSERGQEALLREHYGVVKPGEGVIQIVTQASTTDSADTSSKGWLKGLFRTLFSW
ncbi:septum formation initiator family protein [Patescibacteria group bacterium]|nr:septum formation initiator family protein [Patescibacteria group bacterium]